MSLPSPLPLTISEAGFQEVVTKYAALRQWYWCHYRPARRQSGAWSTPVAGYPGCMDIILARDGVVLMVELKRERGSRVSNYQREWLRRAGDHGRLWYPHDWNNGTIIKALL